MTSVNTTGNFACKRERRGYEPEWNLLHYLNYIKQQCCFWAIISRWSYKEFNNTSWHYNFSFFNKNKINWFHRIVPLQVLQFRSKIHRETRWKISHQTQANFLPIFWLLQNSNNQVALPGQNQVAQTQAETQGGPNTVLRVIVEQMVYPISLDVLYQVSYDFCFLSVERFILNLAVLHDFLLTLIISQLVEIYRSLQPLFHFVPPNKDEAKRF